MAGLDLDLDDILAQMSPGSKALSARVVAEQGGPITPKADVIDEAEIVVTGTRPQPRPPMLPAEGKIESLNGNMFTSVPGTLAGNISDVQRQATTTGDVLDSVTQGLEVIQDKKMAIAESVVAAKRGLNDRITSTNNEILSEVAPLFAQRQALADRRAELQNMNPIKRAIFGIFDRNYSTDYVEQSGEVVEEQLAARGAEFEQMNALTQRLLSSTTSNFDDEASLLNLEGENLNQDLMLSSTALQMTRARLADTSAAIGARVELTRSQMLLADKQLTEMDGGQINAAIAASQKNGGKVMVGGAELSTAQLKERQNNLMRQQLALVSAQQDVTSGSLRIRGQRMELAQAADQMLVSHMSAGDVDVALRNNGVFRGRQLNQAQLGQRMSQLNGTFQAQAEYQAGAGEGNRAVQSLQYLSGKARFLGKRATDIFGRNVPPEIVQYLNQVGQLGDNVTQSVDRGKGSDIRVLAGQVLPQVNEMLKRGDDMIAKLAGRMTNDKDAQVGIGAWMRGETLTGEQATRTMMAFAKGGGLPPGVKLGGPAASAMAAGTRALNTVQKSDDWRKANAEGKARLEQAAVSKAAGNNWTGANVDQITNQLPDLAQSMGDDFGKRISPADFRRARAAGDAQGSAEIARRFNKDHGTNFTAAQMGTLFNPSENKALLSQMKTPVNESALATARQAMIQYQTAAWMNNLDQIGGPGTQRSFAKFMSRNDVQGRLGQYADSLAGTSMGAMLADSASPGGVRNAFGRAAQYMGQMVTANEIASLQNARQAVGTYASDPVMRAQVVIGAMPGLTQHEKALATGVIKSAMGRADAETMSIAGNPMAEGGGDALVNRTDSLNRAVDQAITSTQYQDPALRKVMAKVAKGWQDQGRMIDNAIHTLSTGEQR